MTVANRETARDKLAELLTTALVGSGKPAQAVYNYQVGDFQNMAPAVVVTSGPIQRQRQAYGDCYTNTITLYVNVFVPYADPASSWTEAHAEDAIDLIEKTIAETVLNNLSAPGYWNQCRYAPDEATLIGGVEIGGVEYRREIISIECEVIE